jgi:hypothetical protein
MHADGRRLRIRQAKLLESIRLEVKEEGATATVGRSCQLTLDLLERSIDDGEVDPSLLDLAVDEALHTEILSPLEAEFHDRLSLAVQTIENDGRSVCIEHLGVLAHTPALVLTVMRNSVPDGAERSDPVGGGCHQARSRRNEPGSLDVDGRGGYAISLEMRCCRRIAFRRDIRLVTDGLT